MMEIHCRGFMTVGTVIAAIICVGANVLLRYRMTINPQHPVKPKFQLTMLFMEHGLT